MVLLLVAHDEKNAERPQNLVSDKHSKTGIALHFVDGAYRKLLDTQAVAGYENLQGGFSGSSAKSTPIF